jgi:mono/diheme cytochrome c family protein
VSIPAVRKNPAIFEYAFQIDPQASDNTGSPIVDTTPQPYVEVLPGAPGYDVAAQAATDRLSILHTGSNPDLPPDPTAGLLYSRYKDPGDTGDILDPAVVADPICHPIPTPNGGLTPTGDTVLAYPLPNHPDWVDTDLSQLPGAWAPRQPNWPSVLVEQQVPPIGSGCGSSAGVEAAYADQVDAVGLVQNATLDQIRSVATTAVPFGVWQQQAGCSYSSQQTVSDFTGSARPHWMDVANPSSSAPVFKQAPGASIFKMICINCHGPKADSNGRLAQNLATMTGGNAQVADFRDGLVGPPGAAVGHRNMDAVYGVLPSDAGPSWTGVTVDDRAARYMAWMGLGGTSVNIPPQLLQLVAVTQVLGVQRIAAGELSANMLSQAKSLCLSLLGTTYVDDVTNGGSLFTPGSGHGYLDTTAAKLNSRLILQNGDAELWLSLCSLANPQPVHILTTDPHGSPHLHVAVVDDTKGNLAIDGANGNALGALFPASAYPAGAAVGNERGEMVGSLVPDNQWPWCMDDRAATPAQVAWITASNLSGYRCPKAVTDASDACSQHGTPSLGTCFGNDAANSWAVRGAINAGMSVFTYVQSIENMPAPPDYNQCPSP